MTTFQKTLIALATGSLLSVSANAAINYSGQPYIGAKIGQFDADLNGASTDKTSGWGVYGGYNFDPYFGVEAEYVGSSDGDATIDGINGEYDVKSYGVYGTYRYQFPVNGFYAKGKLGIAKTDVDASASAVGKSVKVESDDTSLAGGIGLGYNVAPNLSVEGEYAITGSDANLLSIGAHLKF